VAQPKVTVGGADVYPTLNEKAAALGYSLIRNHGFLDGNKRIAHAAMEVFLVMNEFEISAPVDGLGLRFWPSSDGFRRST
jgi:death-on-curing protein